VTTCLRQDKTGWLLDVKATPKAAHDAIAGIRNGELLVKVTAAPDKGKANAAIVSLLAGEMGVPKSAFEQVAGETSRNKRFRLASHVDAVQDWLRGFTNG
jgi:uncharacterized protein